MHKVRNVVRHLSNIVPVHIALSLGLTNLACSKSCLFSNMHEVAHHYINKKRGSAPRPLPVGVSFPFNEVTYHTK